MSLYLFTINYDINSINKMWLNTHLKASFKYLKGIQTAARVEWGCTDDCWKWSSITFTEKLVVKEGIF